MSIVNDYWKQDHDAWFNLWRCIKGNAITYRKERDGAPMAETTAYRIISEYCAKCHNKGGCKFYDLYR